MQHTAVKNKKPSEENLKQRAYLNSITSVLDYAARVITGFIVTPFLVSGLGNVLFGVWKVLEQFTSYTNLADIKATEVLKWAVARDRDIVSESKLQDYVTATFVLIILILPIILIVGAVIVWFSPKITGIGTEYTNLVRVTAGTLLLALVINKVFNLFESILRGMNLGFKRMGFRALIFIIGGLLQILVITFGYGLIELAVVQVIVNLMIGCTIYFIVKKNVPWFGWGRIDIKESLSFFRTGGWFMGWSGTRMLLMNSDKILLGYLAGPRLVTQYVISYYLIKAIEGVINNVVHGVVPGIGKLYGNKEYQKLLKIRRQTLLLSWVLIMAFGGTIYLINSAFVNLWVGSDSYAGQLVTFLVIIIATQHIFVNIDQAIINTTLDIKKKVFFGFVSSIISICLSVPLIKLFGIAGLCISLIIGRSLMTISFPFLISEKLGGNTLELKSYMRLIITTFFISVIVFFIEKYIIINGWFVLISYFLLVPIIISLICFYSGINKKNREKTYYYIKNIKFFNK